MFGDAIQSDLMHAPDAPALPVWRKASILLPGWWSGAGFALQGVAATALALWVCILLNLKTPYTAALTVWVVANTRHGHVLAKSFHRVCGTLLGGVVSVALVALLGSTPELLLVCLALWVGACTALGNLLRHYRSYFGFLAGYTAAFIVLGAYHHPDRVLETALDRTASIVIGVLSISWVGSLSGKRRAVDETWSVLQKLRSDCLKAISLFPYIESKSWTGIRLQLNSDFLQAEDQLEYADIESHGFRLRMRRHWALSRFLIDLVEVSRVTARRMDEAGLQEKQRLELQLRFRELVRSVELAGNLETDLQLQGLIGRLQWIGRELEEASGAEAVILQPLVQFLERWLPRLDVSCIDRVPLHFPRHMDLPGALRHGLRTTLALLMAIGFWMLSGWSEGPVFVFNCAAFCALNAGMGHPGRSLGMIGGSAAFAAISGFFLKFYLLPMAGGFPAMILCLAVVLVPIAFMTRSKNPWIATTGATGGFLVLALVQPANHMTYYPAAYLSSASATIFAALFAIPAFALILPNRPAKEPARLIRVMARKVAKLPFRLIEPSTEAWHVTTGDLLKRLQSSPFATSAQLDEGLRLADLGIQLLRLRRADRRLKGFPECRVAIGRVFVAASHSRTRAGDHLRVSQLALEALADAAGMNEATRRGLAVPLAEYRHLHSNAVIP